MSRIENLRKLAELNLCDKCFRKYKAVIEPTIKKWLLNPLYDWRRVESYVLQIAMRVAGAYKTSVNIIYIEKEDLEANSNLINKEIFSRIDRLSFKRKIDYLHNQGILGDASYIFLDETRKVRNKIHEDFNEFTEQDLAMFGVANTIAAQFFYAVVPNTPDEISTSWKENAEAFAKEMLNKFGLSS